MDKNIFWQIIASVNSEVSDRDQNDILRVTQEKLLDYDPREIASWFSIQRYYKELADTSGIFAASCVLNDCMSDDGFTDFRMWLISMGKEVYMAALKDPDSLTSLDISEDTRFELYGYVADYAFKKISIGSVYDEMEQHPLSESQMADILAEIEYYPHEVHSGDAAEHLTDLHSKHLEPGDSISFSYRRDDSNLEAEEHSLTELEKLKNAARLIENMTGCRFKECSSIPFIYPDTDRLLAVNMRSKYDNSIGRYRTHFDVSFQKLDSPIDAAGILVLQQEAGRAYALMSALEMQEYMPTMEEMREFNGFIYQREQQEQSGDVAPSMGGMEMK